ncbi:hypothetical protein [Variovorax sp. PAMC26660]|uniref:hypothetical protein n=1 Tax=Variovorax sp. PAMC26660 TaxID=2762322 RepID=UPI00164DFA75|nr:hypothetical protein [Variovorax sp. PAMC26660]QNK70059.1 hypothetical protein H7F35_10405 [Variovorax sp. PAMC26660]
MDPLRRRAAFGLVLLPAAFVARRVRAQAPAPVLLFKVVSPRDDIVVGIEAAQLGTGTTPPVQRLAALLADKGQLTLWQYASQHDTGGALVQAPLRQVVVFKNDLLRLEPYATPLPIKPPGATAKP